MGNRVNIDTTILSNKIEGIKQAFETGKFADALVTALNTGNGLMQQRVIDRYKDINGNDFGVYIGKKGRIGEAALKALLGTKSRTDRKRIKEHANEDLTAYQRKRVNKGRQIAHKDLEFTGGLRRSIETQVAEKDGERAAVLNFSTLEMALIAHGQENQITNIRNGQKGTTSGIGVKIFGLDQSEREQVNEQAILLIKEALKAKK